jgi:hypothetical protein
VLYTRYLQRDWAVRKEIVSSLCDTGAAAQSEIDAGFRKIRFSDISSRAVAIQVSRAVNERLASLDVTRGDPSLWLDGTAASSYSSSQVVQIDDIREAAFMDWMGTQHPTVNVTIEKVHTVSGALFGEPIACAYLRLFLFLC